jgi:hypothetical protein
MTLPHIPPLDDFLDDVESFPGETFADKLKAHAEAFLGLPHIPESEKRQKEPEIGVSVDAKKHPDYPIRHGIPAMDRCICGGVRHWHAVAPYGCDDCECTEFTLNENWRP